MKAWTLGQPGIENLKLVDMEMPEPGPGQVRLRMNAACVNFRDTLIATGGSPDTRPSLVPLSDGCGVVEALGAGVERVTVGDRVNPLFFPTWMGGEFKPEHQLDALGGARDGCLSEYMVIEAEAVVKVPDHLSDVEACTLPCAGVTAWHCLFDAGGLKPGDVVVAQGTGGVSIYALQFAKMAGAQVIITSSSDEKLARAKQMGADHTINYRKTPNWSEEVMKITNGRGADIVVEVGGAGTINESLNAVRVAGYIGVIGILTGVSSEVAVFPDSWQRVADPGNLCRQSTNA